ncbi:response regulator transcription factor [Pseudomonas japonica]|uniref:response regulator transcription factor n=1 Tax=Pseudomonas japonica TaxID=256466 RepID=UPI0015E27F58|nr:response regulator transcription factor [Pseudomonas japonica]MBA1290020.1 response regulator transcription factor [Pseudomonas japonica]
MATAVIIDDQPYIRVILKRILVEEGVTVLAECSDGIEGMAQARELKPDILVMELVLPGLDGMDVINRIRRQAPGIQIVVVTACPAEFSMDRCMRAGVTAYISKSTDIEVFRKAIQAVRAGFICFPNVRAGSELPSHSDPDERVRIAGLSARELAVLRYLAMGFSNLQIGQALLLSNKTISSYKTRLVKKLKVRSVICLAELAHRHGVV